jgi:steroid 5-alpha reductase family enzyme
LFSEYSFFSVISGVWITEQSSMRRRGAEFRQYKDLAPAFFPWFPRKKTG